MAAVSRGDRHHEVCRELLEGRRSEGLVVPVTVTVEVDYLLRARVSAHAARAFMADVDAGRYILAPTDAAVFARACELDGRLADLGLGLVDASVVAVAEKLGASAIATLDAEHFSVAVEGRWPLVP